MLLTGLLL